MNAPISSDPLAHGPVVHVRMGPRGVPVSAVARGNIARPVARVWSVVADVEGYARRVPMIGKVRRTGDRVIVDLKFKISLFSVGFQFTADATYEAEKWLELRWVAGEPRGIRLRFDLTPSEDGQACVIRTEGEFDAQSLGWLAKYFLRHHPEIELGIFPGVTLALVESMRRAAEEG